MAATSVRVGIGLNPFDGDGGGIEGLWRLAEQLEEDGWDSLWLSDTASLGGLAPLPALAAVGARTRRLKLGTSVLVLPPRNPVLLARELATVDALTGGRLLPAGGLGIDLPAELEAMGVRREERGARAEEAIAIVKALWAGDPVTWAGRFHRLTEVRLRPRPVRRRLELWLGGLAPAALRRVGRVADGWLASFVGPEEFAEKVEVIKAAAAAAGRSIDADHYGATLFAAPTAAEVPAALEALARRRPGLAPGDHVAIGAAATRALLQRFRAAGAQKFVLHPVARDERAWLAELRREAVDPVEAAG